MLRKNIELNYYDFIYIIFRNQDKGPKGHKQINIHNFSTPLPGLGK